MNILVTGGLGYVGSHLCDRLFENNNIVILDNFSNNINSVRKQKNVEIVNGDICDKKIVDDILGDIDIIVHTAAQTSVAKSIENIIYDVDNNINGTINLLDAVRRSDVERFIYISSAAVYGIPKYLPLDERHTTNPIYPYGLSKLTGERYSLLYHKFYGLHTVCLRPFNIFGPGQMKNSYSGIITKFIENVKNDNDLIIFGDGNQTRDFVYINDVIDTILLAMKNNKAIGKVFNIGTGSQTKVKDLADNIMKISNKKVLVNFENPRVGDIIDSYSDITKARKILLYEPKYSLCDGLKLCLQK